MIIRKICGIIARPFKAAIITARLAAASPVRMAPILAPVALTMVSLGLDGCIERYDDFGNADKDIEFKNPDISDSMSDTTDATNFRRDLKPELSQELKQDLIQDLEQDLGQETGQDLDQEAETIEVKPADICGSNPNEIITNKIIDQNLLKMIRLGLNKGETDNITLAEAQSMTVLVADSSKISSISGIECFTNLTYLGLNFNKILDISPVVGLKKLTYFNIYQNLVKDISPIADHPFLVYVSLGYNLFSDISALLNNPGIGQDDVICLDGNDQVPAWQITALKEKGVNVTCAW